MIGPAHVLKLVEATQDKHFVDGLGINLCPRCPECRKRRVTPWVKGNDSGYHCLSCGWSKNNEKPITTDFVCGCGRRMGQLTVHGDEKPRKRICEWCAERRIAKGLHPNPNVLVRREVFCICGCGKMIAWTDFKETVPLAEVLWRSRYFYSPCAKAGRRELQKIQFGDDARRWSRVAFEVSVSQPAVDITNITGSITNISTTLLQAIQQSGFYEWFGTGADSSLTLGSNTTLAAATNIKHFTTLTLSTFTLDHNAADFGLVIYCQTSLTSSAGGAIVSDKIGGGGTSGAAAGANAGAGGAGGGASGFIYVYAKKITGTGSIGGGVVGTAGGNAVAGANGSNSGGSAGGAASAKNKQWLDQNDSNTAAQAAGGGNNGGAAAAGGAGGTATTPTAAQVTATANDYLRYIHIGGLFDSAQAVVAPPDSRQNTAPPGSGGGGGAITNNTISSTANGGAGGGGGAYVGAGGAGGNGGTSANATNNSSGGGGGGGGGGASVTVVVTTSLSSTWTIKADGGTGGAGGNGNGASGNGAGGGGGGSGGICVLINPSGSGVTPTAAGGAGGAQGTGTGNGVAGNAGANGKAHNVAY